MTVVDLRELPAPDAVGARRPARPGRRGAAIILRCPNRSCWPSPITAEAPPGERVVLVRRRRGGARWAVAVLSPARDGSTVRARRGRPRVVTPEHDVETALLRLAVRGGAGGLAASTSGSCRPPRPTTPGSPPRASPPSATCSRCGSRSPSPDDVVAGDPAPGDAALRPRPRRGGVGRDQQPGLRRPPRAGRVDRRRAARAHGRRLGRPRRLPGGRRSRRARSHRGLLDQGPPRPRRRSSARST